jgi:hypothetical protein
MADNLSGPDGVLASPANGDSKLVVGLEKRVGIDGLCHGMLDGRWVSVYNMSVMGVYLLLNAANGGGLETDRMAFKILWHVRETPWMRPLDFQAQTLDWEIRDQWLVVNPWVVDEALRDPSVAPHQKIQPISNPCNHPSVSEFPA